MDLPLLVDSVERDAERLGEASAILVNRIVIVAEMKAQIERVVRRAAHATRARGKEVSKPVPIQKGGMEPAHSVCCSTPSLRVMTRGAKRSVFQVRAGSWVCIDFLPSNGPRRCGSP